MKKEILIVAMCFTGLTAAAQTDGMVTEEKTSAWVKVTAVTNSVSTPRNSTGSTSSATVSKPVSRSATPKPATSTLKNSQPKPAESFNKTNQKVKRFKKG